MTESELKKEIQESLIGMCIVSAVLWSGIEDPIESVKLFRQLRESLAPDYEPMINRVLPVVQNLDDLEHRKYIYGMEYNRMCQY